MFSEQQGCCCVASSGRSTAVSVSTSPLHLHRRHLCIDDCAAQSLLCHPSAQGLRSANWVFIIELLLPTSSLRPARRRVFYRIASSSSSTTTQLASPSFVRSVLATPTYAFVLDALLDLGNPTAPQRSGGLTASTSASTLTLPPCLHRLHRCLPSTSMTVLIASTLASPPRTTTVSTRLRHYHGAPCAPAAPSTRHSDHN